jgi:hypothetical protein
MLELRTNPTSHDRHEPTLGQESQLDSDSMKFLDEAAIGGEVHTGRPGYSFTSRNARHADSLDPRALQFGPRLPLRTILGSSPRSGLDNFPIGIPEVVRRTGLLGGMAEADGSRALGRKLLGVCLP